MSSSSRPRALAALVALLAAAALVLAAAPDASARPRPARPQPAHTRVATATTAASPCTSAPAPTAARLRVRITSTTPRVDLHVRPGQVTGRKSISATGGATTGYLADGFRVNLPTSSAQGVVETEIVTVDPSLSRDISIAVDKASAGSVSVKVWASSGYGKAVSLSTRSTTAQITVPRSSLFDPAFSLPKADGRKLVLAAYYPWFTAAGWETLPVAERPSDPRSAWSPSGVLSLTKQARTNGVDGFVISWMGATKNGEAFDLAAGAAAQTNGVVAPYLEVSEGLSRGGVATVEQWLREAVDRTGPASLTMGGAPVVFVWDMAKVTATDWAAMVARLDRPVKLIGDADTATHGPAMQGWHQYLPAADLTGQAARNAFRSGWFRGQAALDTGLTPVAHVATVSPGFDDRNLRGADRPVVSRDGGRYDATWDAAIAGDPDMILITSWNEWYEGSEVEPGTLNGEAALRTTALRSSAWKSAGTTTCATSTVPRTSASR
jgi:glycoprotein endo-alpha-1,2-mannosidase